MNAGKITLFAGAGVLLAGLVLFGLGFRPPPPRTFQGSVKDLLPEAQNTPGWKVEYMPIADTPEMQAKVDELLNFTDGSFKVYSRGAARISVYIAYWEPGRQTPKEIGRHTPDVCWVKAGWTSEHREVIKGFGVAPGTTITHTECRAFSAQGVRENVVFWHVVGGDIHSYETGGRPPWYAVITDTLRWGADQKKEQFFVRISSNMPIDQVFKEEWVRNLVSSVPGLVDQGQI